MGDPVKRGPRLIIPLNPRRALALEEIKLRFKPLGREIYDDFARTLSPEHIRSRIRDASLASAHVIGIGARERVGTSTGRVSLKTSGATFDST